MDELNAWLASMPRGAVRARIAQLERELEVLRVLQQQHATQPRQAPASQRSPDAAITQTVSTLVSAGRRLSRQRQAIIDVMRGRPDGTSPNEIARALDMAPNAVQTNLSRMTQAGLVVRMGQGRYRLPEDEGPPEPDGFVLPTTESEGANPS